MKNRQVIDELLRIVGAPWFLILALTRAGLLGRHKNGPVISLSPQLNTINDQTSILLQAEWVKRYGLFGKHWNGQGVSLGLGHHPPLGKLLFLCGGIRGYFILALLLHTGAFLMLAAGTGHWWMLLLVPYILLSPYVKNNAVVTGRFDFPAWPFFLATLAFWLQGSVGGALACAICGALIHPTLLLLIPVYLGLLTSGSPDRVPALLLFGLLYGLALAFWAVPFFRARKYTGVARLQWRFGKLADPTRSIGIGLQKLGFYLPFLAATVILAPANLATVTAVPALLLLFSLYREQFINRFSLEMLIVTGGALVVFQVPHFFLSATYLLAIYGYASPSPRTGLDVGAVVLPAADRRKLEDFYRPLPEGARMLYLPYIGAAADMRLSAKYNLLICLPGLRTERQEFVGGACFGPGAGLPPHPHNVYLYKEQLTPERLRVETARHGIGYLIVFAGPVQQMLDDYGYRQASRLDFPGIGSVPEATLYLYRCPVGPSLVDPAVAVTYGANDLEFRAEKKGLYHVKYLYYPAWRAFLDGRRLDIAYNEYGMFVNLSAPGEVRFQYRYRHCWEQDYRAQYQTFEKRRGTGDDG